MILEKSENISERDRQRLLILGALFAVFFSIYTGYSVGKFKILQARSIIKSNLVMKVIHHNVNCVCPRCGAKGIPLCPACAVPMYWNGYCGFFICPSCGQEGFPRCARCNEVMSWIEAR